MRKQKSKGLKHLNDSKVFLKTSIDMDDTYKNIFQIKNAEY